MPLVQPTNKHCPSVSGRAPVPLSPFPVTKHGHPLTPRISPGNPHVQVGSSSPRLLASPGITARIPCGKSELFLHLSFYNLPSTDPSLNLEISGQCPEQLLCPYIWLMEGGWKKSLICADSYLHDSANSISCPSVSLSAPLQLHHTVLALHSTGSYNPPSREKARAPTGASPLHSSLPFSPLPPPNTRLLKVTCVKPPNHDLSGTLPPSQQY